jgi:uncharacterized protein YggE
MRQVLVSVCGVILAAAGRPATAQAPEHGMPPHIRCTGEASVSAKPDRARLQIGVVTQAATAQAAAADNARQSEATIAALKHSLGENAAIRTSGYSLNPDFSYPKPGEKAVLTGYTASNTVEVTTDDLANAGKLIDAATQAGANNVQGIEFLLKDEEPVRQRALREAARKARAAADTMASALGLRVVRVLAVEEGSPQVIRPARAMAMAASAPTPVEAGNIQVQATVTLTVEVSP